MDKKFDWADYLLSVGFIVLCFGIVVAGGIIGCYYNSKCGPCVECIVSDTSLIEGHDGVYYDDSLNEQCKKLLNETRGLTK